MVPIQVIKSCLFIFLRWHDFISSKRNIVTLWAESRMSHIALSQSNQWATRIWIWSVPVDGSCTSHPCTFYYWSDPNCRILLRSYQPLIHVLWWYVCWYRNRTKIDDLCSTVLPIEFQWCFFLNNCTAFATDVTIWPLAVFLCRYLWYH